VCGDEYLKIQATKFDRSAEFLACKIIKKNFFLYVQSISGEQRLLFAQIRQKRHDNQIACNR